NKEFWDKLSHLWMTTDLPVPDLMAGDYNLVEEAIDRNPHRHDDPDARAALARFKRLMGLQNGWRKTNPDTKAYTYTSTHKPPTLSRIDRIDVSAQQFKCCRGWDISDAAGGISDHRLVSVLVSDPGSPYVGLGRYAIPLSLTRDKLFVDYAIREGIEIKKLHDQPRTIEENVQTAFKKYKDKLSEFAQRRASALFGTLEKKKRKLQAERETLLNPGQSEE
ncbi:hypothetical protein GGX14DRAFT_301646, partial [Mycena pura]